MHGTGTILIGFDGSDNAENAIRRAGEVLATKRAIVASVGDSLPEAEQTAARGAALAEEAGFQASPMTERARTKAWPTLLRMAEEHDAAAVVVGSRGLGRIKSALVGSVSSGVLDHARRPVLLVPPNADPRPPGPVVIGYDGSGPADAAVGAAGRLLEVRETLLQTVWLAYSTVAPAALVGASVAVVSGAAEEIDRDTAAKARDTAARGARLASTFGLEVRGEAVEGHGSIWGTLLDIAGDHRAAAIAVGSRGMSGLEAVLVGSVSRGLVHHSQVPVLVVRPPK